MRRYYIEVYDRDVDEWVDCFPFDPEGIYETRKAAEYQVHTMKEVDEDLGEHNEYRITEL